MLAAQELDQVEQVVLELADIVHVATTLSRLEVSAKIGQDDLRGAAQAYRRRERVIAPAVIRRSVHEDQDPVRGRVVIAIGELLAVAGRVAPQAGRIDVGWNLPQRREVEHVFRRFHPERRRGHEDQRGRATQQDQGADACRPGQNSVHEPRLRS
jgi:hypothetical protein